MRYNEHTLNQKPPAKEKKERTLPTPGSYGSKELEKSKNIPWRK